MRADPTPAIHCRSTSAPTLLGTVAFTGRLRASRIADGQVVLVNAAGQVIRSDVPAPAREA